MAKVRNGFVSNSSSSSFIVEFTKDPRDIENLKEMMGDCGANPYGYAVTSEEVINVVHKDVMRSEPMTSVIDFGEEWEFNYDLKSHLSYYNIETWCMDDDKFKEIAEGHKAYLKSVYEKVTGNSSEANTDKFIYKFEYSDESSFWAAIEHGDVFRNLPHTRESHH